MVLDPLERRDDEPTFDEPWQAQVLGMADILVTAGVISADAWARTLGAELGKSSAAGAEDNVEEYYRAVLAALQILRCAYLNLTSPIRPAVRRFLRVK